MLSIDLHSHSTVSDGLLSPDALVERAATRGVRVLALTDHDDVGGLSAARATALRLGVNLVNGVEISVTWNSQTLHVVGLDIDPACPDLLRGLHVTGSSRAMRAEKIATELKKIGIHGALEGAYAHADNARLVGRTHFARYLAEQGYAADVRGVFKKFLTPGKPGYVEHHWAALADAVGWIRQSGGLAVMAHPGRYPLIAKQMRQLLAEFRQLGGMAVEVVTGSHVPAQYAVFARYAAEFGLLASAGSDFHGQGESHRDIGQLPDLPVDCDPVWRQLRGVSPASVFAAI